MTADTVLDTTATTATLVVGATIFNTIDAVPEASI